MLSSRRLRALSWALMALVGIGALAYGMVDDGAPNSNAERAAAVAASIACPECDGQPVSESNATIAEIIRAEIKTQVDAGYTDAEIRQVYVDRYGEWVDLSPSSSGLTGVVWVAPFLVTGAALGGLALAFSRWRSDVSDQHASAEDLALVDAALHGSPAGESDEAGRQGGGETHNGPTSDDGEGEP